MTDGRPVMSDRRFTKRVRLLRPSEFERVFATRVSAGDVSMVVYGLENDLGHPRLGLTVSRRLGGAVVRNRWKRLVREAFRLTQGELPSLDLVCLPRGEARPELSQLVLSLPALAARIERKFRGGTERTSEKSP